MGQAFKNVLAAGPARKAVSHLQPLRCPAPGHPEVVVTAKPSAMETVVQPRSRLPEEQGSCSRWVGAASCCPPGPLFPCLLGLGSLWTLKRFFFCRETHIALPLCMPGGRPQALGSPSLWLPAAFQPPNPHEGSIPVGPAGGSLRRWPGMCWTGHQSWPGASLPLLTVWCLHPGPGLGSPSQRGLPPPVVPGVSVGRNQKPALCFPDF